MKMAPLAEVKSRFSEYINECRNGAVVVTKNGRPTAALVPINNDEDLERIVLSNSKMFSRLLERAEKQIKAGRGIPHDRFWRQMEKEKNKAD